MVQSWKAFIHTVPTESQGGRKRFSIHRAVHGLLPKSQRWLGVVEGDPTLTSAVPLPPVGPSGLLTECHAQKGMCSQNQVLKAVVYPKAQMGNRGCLRLGSPKSRA